MTDETDPGTIVIQDDRIAAADLLDEVSALLDHVGIGQVADLIRDGEYDEHEATIAFARHRIAAQSQPAATVQELHAAATDVLGRWEALTPADRSAKVRLRVALTALTAEPAAKEGDADKLFAAINKEAKRANEVIRLNRHREGQGMITVATAMHRIEQWSERLSPPSPQPDMGSTSTEASRGKGGC